MNPPIAFAALVVFATLSFSPAAARGDVFELKDGGQVEGELIAGAGGSEYLVRTADGVEVTIARPQLDRVVQQDATRQEYLRRSRAAADTAEAHRELAAWCREQKLSAEADVHLERVAELDPTDEEARRSLGYLKVGGRWLSREEVMAERGMVFYEGKYRTRQDIAIRERAKQADNVEVDWFGKIRLWRGWLDKRRPGQAEEAQALIAAINDPNAAPALVRILSDEDDEYVFELLLAVLGRLDHPAAITTLVAYSLDHDDDEIRHKCIDYLTSGVRPVSIIPYVQALKSKDNVIVNRAAEALGLIGNPEAISPLIDALVTTHRYQVQAEQPGISAGFSPSGGGGGLSMGGNGPKIIRKDEENPDVLQALAKLAGTQEFEYDETAWRHWYVDQQMRQRINARRDE
jgi:hypothetical protein